MALDLSQFKLQQDAGQEAQEATTQGKRPHLDLSQFKLKAAEPIDSAVVEQVAKAPQPTPTPSQEPTVSDIDTQVEPVKHDPSTFQSAFGEGTESFTGTKQADTKGMEDFARDEGLPMAGALALTALTVGTGGMAGVAIAMGSAAIGGFAGEAIEQTLKFGEVLPYGAQEKPAKDGYEIAERAAWQGGEEALYTLVPELLVRGGSAAVKGMFLREQATVNTKFHTDYLSVLDDEAVASGTAVLKDGVAQAPRKLSDVVGAKVLSLLETVGRESFFAGRGIRGLEAEQKGLVKSAIHRKLDEVSGFGTRHTDGLVDAATELNTLGVASVIDQTLNKVSRVQRAAAGKIYGDITQALDDAGQEGFNAFTVDTKSLLDFADKRQRKTLIGGDVKELDAIFALPETATVEEAFETLKSLKSMSRDLGKGMADNASNRKSVVDTAASILRKELDTALDAAETAGMNVNGESIKDLMAEADGIWKQNAEDFQNDFIKSILKQTDALNGSPERLAAHFLKSENSAKSIVKILDDADLAIKNGETGFGAEEIAAARSAIKGTVMHDIFNPMDSVRGRITAPRYQALEGNKETLKRLFGSDDYEHMVALANAFSKVNGETSKNVLAFAQGARESGSLIKAAESMIDMAKAPGTQGAAAFLTQGWSLAAMWAIAATASKGATSSGRFILNMGKLVDDTYSPTAKRNILREVVHTVQRSVTASDGAMSPEQRKRLTEEFDDDKEFSRNAQKSN